MSIVGKTDLTVLPSAFDSMFTGELQQKTNRNPVATAADSDLQVVKQWAELQDGTMRSMQGFVSNNVRNVREFGDAGTGVSAATNTTTLQAAIDACTVDGDTLYLGSGTYNVNSTLNVTGRFQLKGSADRSVISWSGAAGGVVINISDAIWTMENIEFQAPGGDKPLNFIDQTVLSTFCTMRDVYFNGQASGSAVKFGLGWRHLKTEGVQFNGCAKGFDMTTVASMGSNIAFLEMNNMLVGDDGIQTGPPIFILDTLGIDIGFVVVDGCQYVLNTEPVTNSAIVSFDEDNASGPFVTVVMRNIQVSGTFSKTVAQYLLFVDKSTDITNAFRFRMDTVMMINGGVTLDAHLGGAFPPHVKTFTKDTIFHSATWIQDSDINIADNEMHFRTATGVGNRDIIKSTVEVEGNPRFRLEHQGEHFWGDGSGSGDVRLYRGGAGILATDTNLRVSGRIHNNDLDTLTNTATPSVAAGNVFITGGTTTITDLTGGTHSQVIIIKAVHTLTITHGASTINLQGDVNFDMVTGDNLTLFYDGTDWWESSRRT